MVLDLIIVFVENQWLSSCKIDLNKINMPDRIICDEWIINLNAGKSLPWFLFNR